ncbi:hypothetical protein [Falsiroseomonas sp.]|uniref:hypothetical protein n=1 Tax=Falsiroseomonas sp. TaxID=2870721 RepID=UPI002720AC8F|nr:hypothetical protein [Falsiroseomonas sp.]MDO9498777.1 hypothetical protein [Falsiroseomonas sp.]
MSPLGNLLGVRMNLLVGPDPVALPASPNMLEAFQELEVVHSDRGPSGFRLVFRIGRAGPLDVLENLLVADPRLDLDARVIVTVLFDILPRVILDGIVTERHVRPGGGAGDGTLTLMGRDLSWQMDKEERRVGHPAMDETAIAALIALRYPQYGLLPMTIPPRVVDPPIPLDRTPQQSCSDWAYLKLMARRHGYEVHVDPGPAPGANTLYFGPPVMPGLPQKAITVNAGAMSDANDLDVVHSGEDLATAEGAVLDRLTGQVVPVMAPMPTRMPLGAVPEAARRFGRTRTLRPETSGLNAMQAQARVMALVDDSAAQPVRVTGTLDTVRYNAPLRARALVDLRGAGLSFNGTYKVAEVRHRIAPGSYTQDFTLTRSERLPVAPLVRAV